MASGSQKSEQDLKKEVQQFIRKPRPITFDDIVGLEALKEEMEVHALYPIKYPERYPNHDKLKKPKGILLHGPPGTGKTFIVEAIAYMSGATFFYVDSACIMSRYFGESERKIKYLFELARTKSPSVIFIDEIYSLVFSDGHGANERIMTQIQTSMDGVGCEAMHQIVLIGNTNKPETMDCAIISRFSLEFFVGLPSLLDRMLYVASKMRRNHDDEFSFSHCYDVASLTENWSFRRLEQLYDRVTHKVVARHIHSSPQKVRLAAPTLDDFKNVIKSMKSRLNSINENWIRESTEQHLKSINGIISTCISKAFPKKFNRSQNSVFTFFEGYDSPNRVLDKSYLLCFNLNVIQANDEVDTKKLVNSFVYFACSFAPSIIVTNESSRHFNRNSIESASFKRSSPCIRIDCKRCFVFRQSPEIMNKYISGFNEIKKLKTSLDQKITENVYGQQIYQLVEEYNVELRRLNINICYYDQVLQTMFEHLPIADQFRCRRVNKLWKLNVESVINRQDRVMISYGREMRNPKSYQCHDRRHELSSVNVIVTKRNFTNVETECLLNLLSSIRVVRFCIQNNFKVNWLDLMEFLLTKQSSVMECFRVFYYGGGNEDTILRFRKILTNIGSFPRLEHPHEHKYFDLDLISDKMFPSLTYWQKVKQERLSMPTEERRKYYESNYTTVDEIPTWFVFAKILKITSPKGGEFSVNPSLSKKISLVTSDITKLEIDAIVNAANPQLTGDYGGVDGAIHTAAGYDLLQGECRTLGGCEAGDAKITGGYNLPARYIIHTVGPVGEKPGLLKNAYQRCLEVAIENNVRTIAFPCISTGLYRYPKDRAAEVALKTVRTFLERHGDAFDRIIFCTFEKTDSDIYERLLPTYFPVES